MKLAKNLERLGTESAFAVLAEAKKLEAQGKPMIHLGLGQPDFKTPQHVVDAANKALDDGHHGYVLSNGILECRQAVTRKIKKLYNKDVDPERVLIMPGGKPTMYYAIQCFGEPGAEIIHPTPAFPIYESMINYTGSTAVPYDLTEDKDLKFNPEKILSLITDKTRLLILINPNNPTGTILPYDEIRRFVDAVPENIMVLIDEAYIHFVREENYQTAVKLSQEYKNVIVTRTFSKMYGMAGLRVGYAVGHKSIMSELRAAGNSGGIGSINCYAAIAALKDTAFVRHVKRLTNASKDYFYQELENLGLSYVPSHSSFVMVNVNQNGQALRQKLLARNIKVRTYGSSIIKNYIRFSIGTLDEMQATVGVLTEEIKG
jgi:histidinol-phosphate aminotransferase